jgi:hypothetical protein
MIKNRQQRNEESANEQIDVRSRAYVYISSNKFNSHKQTKKPPSNTTDSDKSDTVRRTMVLRLDRAQHDEQQLVDAPNDKLRRVARLRATMTTSG